ncbi:XRE family transcriptional regulator [Streptococcus pluranimalium]|uniref:XRE family transcriptional regulator n=1 Tax=Streptococcus pluranimalium TaxID=82348 RepID=UPI003F68E648
MTDRTNELILAIERDSVSRLLDIVERMAKDKRIEPNLTGLISENRLKNELEVTSQTLKLWRDKGLKPYLPPVVGTKKRYYKINDVLGFLEVN